MEKKYMDEAISLYKEIIAASMTEGLFEVMDEILKEDPTIVDIFIKKFNHPTKDDDKEILCQIILKQLNYPPAIDYLKNEMGWDDFTGYAGFPDS